MPRNPLNGMDYLRGHPDPAEEPHFEATEYCEDCGKTNSGWYDGFFFYGDCLGTELDMDDYCKCEEEE
jgi:hypothetical protein